LVLNEREREEKKLFEDEEKKVLEKNLGSFVGNV
jgi:hypothetical protein